MAELDENQVKIMIIKLQQIEKLIKEIGKEKKRKAKFGHLQPQQRDRKGRRSSVNSKNGTGLADTLK